MTKGKSLRTIHLIIGGRVSILVFIISVILVESLGWRRRKRYEATHLSLLSSNMADTSVHLTQLIAESVKASIHALKLSHGGLKNHTTTRRRGSGMEWRRLEESLSQFVATSIETRPRFVKQTPCSRHPWRRSEQTRDRKQRSGKWSLW